jgi:hypothetical protein
VAGDLLSAGPDEVRRVLGIATSGLLATVQAAHTDLRERKGAVLVANGGLALLDDRVDAMVAREGLMGLALANTAKHRLVGMLSHRLRPEGVFVGEVMVFDVVKGTAFDRRGDATFEARRVGAKFWEVYAARSPTFAQAR